MDIKRILFYIVEFIAVILGGVLFTAVCSILFLPDQEGVYQNVLWQLFTLLLYMTGIIWIGISRIVHAVRHQDEKKTDWKGIDWDKELNKNSRSQDLDF